MAEGKNQIVMTGAQLIEAYRAEQGKLEALQGRIQQLQTLVSEANTAEEAVKEIKKAAKDEKIIVDLGAGVYTEAVLDGNEKFKTGLAGSIMMNSDYEKTLDYLKNQKEMIQKDIDATAREQQNSINALNEIGALLQQAERQAQEKIRQAQKSEQRD